MDRETEALIDVALAVMAERSMAFRAFHDLDRWLALRSAMRQLIDLMERRAEERDRE